MLRRILLVDASPEQRDRLELALDPAGWALHVAPNAQAAVDALGREPFDVALCDARMSGLDGFELLPQLQRKQPQLVIVLAASPDDPRRWESASRHDVFAVIARPLRHDELRFALQGATRRAAEHRRHAVLERDLARAIGDKPIVGASEPMIELLESMERSSGFKTPVLLLGETGTHREVLARTLHAQSVRRVAPFVAVRCSERSSPDTLESFLFGSDSLHEPPAMRTGQIGEAHRGTVFLDDVLALTDGAQRRLVHLIERDELLAVGSEKPRGIDVRVVCASRLPMEEAVGAGQLREDLAGHLAVAVLEVPPLRRRRSDLPLLVDHLVARFRDELGVPVEGVSEAAMQRLMHYEWPGNLRELENVIERAVLLSRGGRVHLDELPPSLGTGEGDGGATKAGDFSLRRARRSFEAEMIRRALRQTDGNRTHAAKLLEISHRALLYKIKEYGLR